jgi:hypothetical protein
MNLVIDDDMPLKIVKVNKLGARGQFGICYNALNNQTRINCTICGLLVPVKHFDQHLKYICPYLPATCELCSFRVTQRQFLQAHKINDCPKVVSCPNCLTYYSAKQDSNEEHVCRLFQTPCLSKNSMPLLRIKDDSYLILQINNLLMTSETPMNLSLFNKDDKSIRCQSDDTRMIDEIIGTTFKELPNYVLIAYNNKTLLGCGDRIYLQFHLQNKNESKLKMQTKYVSTRFSHLQDMIEAATKIGLRLIRSDRIQSY